MNDTDKDVKAVKALLIEQFGHESAPPNPELPIEALRSLRQKPGKTLRELHRWALELLINCGGKDKLEGMRLELSQITLLAIAVKAYRGAILDPPLMLKAIEYNT